MAQALALSLAFLAALGEGTVAPALIERAESLFNWTSITPSAELQYHDCYDGFKCARLQVPMDWSNPTTNATQDNSVAIAIVTLPATVPPTDPSFGGTVITNPGGPSGAGTTFNVAFGSSFQAALDGEKHYEILSFDPRGVFQTTPSADCYSGDWDARIDQYWQYRGFATLSENVQDHYLFNQGLNQLCEQATPEILQHMSSASVARDMVEIVDRVEELRRKETNSTQAKRSSTEKPRLQFMGFSYGSALGMIFASMFPDRVGRLMVDGILDIDDYTNGVRNAVFSCDEPMLIGF